MNSTLLVCITFFCKMDKIKLCNIWRVFFFLFCFCCFQFSFFFFFFFYSLFRFNWKRTYYKKKLKKGHHCNQRGRIQCYWDRQADATDEKLSVTMTGDGESWYKSNETEHCKNCHCCYGHLHLQNFMCFRNHIMVWSMWYRTHNYCSCTNPCMCFLSHIFVVFFCLIWWCNLS